MCLFPFTKEIGQTSLEQVPPISFIHHSLLPSRGARHLHHVTKSAAGMRGPDSSGGSSPAQTYEAFKVMPMVLPQGVKDDLTLGHLVSLGAA